MQNMKKCFGLTGPKIWLCTESAVEQGQRYRHVKGHRSQSSSRIGNQYGSKSIGLAARKRLNGSALQRSQFPHRDLWVMSLLIYTKGLELMEDQSLCLPTLPFHTHCLLLHVFTASSSGSAATVCVSYLYKHLYAHINT